MKLLTLAVLAIIAAVALAAPASAANSSRARILHDAHLKRCPTDAPCSQCFWPASGQIKYINFCGAAGAAVGDSCRCRSTDGWQQGVVIMSHPDRPIGD